MPTFKLHGFPGSDNTSRLEIYLKEKGIEYEFEKVDLMKGEHKTVEFLALNPRGQVPTLEVDDAVLSDSYSGILFVEKHHKEGPALMPSGLKERAVAHTRFNEFFTRFQNKTSFHPLVVYFKKPWKGFWREMETEIKMLKLLESWLAEGDYLAGEYSIVDIAYVTWVGMDWKMGMDFDKNGFPKVGAWLQRMLERDHVKAVLNGVFGNWKHVCDGEENIPQCWVEAAEELAKIGIGASAEGEGEEKKEDEGEEKKEDEAPAAEGEEGEKKEDEAPAAEGEEGEKKEDEAPAAEGDEGEKKEDEAPAAEGDEGEKKEEGEAADAPQE